jgi:hypothetical protein
MGTKIELGDEAMNPREIDLKRDSVRLKHNLSF